MIYETILVSGLLLWLLVAYLYARSVCASIFHPGTYYLTVHGIVFAIRPILAYLLQYDGVYYAYQFQPDYWEKCKALLVADFGLIVFMYFVVSVGHRPMVFRRAPHESIVNIRGVMAFLGAFLLCVPLAIYSTSLNVISKSLDASTMLLDPATGYSINTTSSGYLNDASLMLLPALVVLAWLLRFHWLALVPFVAAVIARAATGSRWPFVMAFFSLCLLFLYEKKSRWINRAFVIGVVPFAVLFTIVGLDRGHSIREFIGIQQTERERSDSQRFLESMDYGNLEFLEYLVVTIPEKTGTYNYFLGNLQIFTEPVPRSLWPGKPIGAPIKLYSLFDYGYPIGMTNSVPGEGWAQLGWLGVFIWCAAFGFAYGKIYDLFVLSKQSLLQVSAYAVFMPLSIAAFRDGFLLTIIKTAAASLMPIILWFAIWRILDAVASYRNGT